MKSCKGAGVDRVVDGQHGVLTSSSFGGSSWLCCANPASRGGWWGGWILAVLAISSPNAFAFNSNDGTPADTNRAQTALAEIAGVDAGAAAKTLPAGQSPAVRTACQHAREQIESGEPRSAVDTLLAVWDQGGESDYEVRYLLALAKVRMEDLAAAREHALAAAELKPDAADAHYLLGQIFQQLGDAESAIKHYRTVTLSADRQPAGVQTTLAWYHLGRCLTRSGYDRAAAEAYANFDTALWQTSPEQRDDEQIAALLAENPYGMVSERLRLLRNLERYQDALGVAEWARAVWPDDAVVARWYAGALVSAGQADRALAFCRQWPADVETAVMLIPLTVQIAQEAGRLEELTHEVVLSIAGGGDLEPARELTRSLNRAGEAAAALRVGRAVLARSPGDVEMSWEVAAARLASGDLRAALERLIDFVRNAPDATAFSPARLATWSKWFSGREQIAGFVRELRARVEADYATDFVLGFSAFAAGQMPLAEELLQSCLAARPDFLPARLARGEILLATYQWEVAKAYAQQLLKDRPDWAAAEYLAARAYDGLDDNQQAESAFKRAIKHQPQELTYKLALARHYRRLGNLRGAQRYFQESFAGDPRNAEAFEELIDCYVRGGKQEIARAQLERVDRAVLPKDVLRRIDTTMRFLDTPFGPEHLAELKSQFERNPDDLNTAQLLAGGLYYRGRLDEACDVLEKARGIYPDDFNLTMLQANLHAARSEYDEAVGLLSALAERFPNRPAVLQPLSVICLNDFRLEQGRAALAHLIEVGQDRAQRSRNRNRLCESYVQLGQCEKALELVEGWIEQDPQDEALIYDKIGALLCCDRKQDAYAIVNRRLEENPSDPIRIQEFIEFATMAEQYAQVADRLKEWLEDRPSNMALTEALINVLLLDKRPDEALQVARRFEGTYSDSLVRRIWLGRCELAKGEIDTALAEFDALLNLRGVPPEIQAKARGQIIFCLSDAGRWDEALQRCEQWLQESGDYDKEIAERLKFEILNYKRHILFGAGRDAECAEVLERLLGYVPNSPEYLNDLGYTWVDAGVHVERATAMIRAALAADPWNAAYIDSLGWACYKAGNFDEAREYLMRAVQLRDGRDPVVYDHLADSAYRSGDWEAACQYWNAAVSLLESRISEDGPARLAEILARIRAKLTAVERSQTPKLAPTAAEQQSQKTSQEE